MQQSKKALLPTPYQILHASPVSVHVVDFNGIDGGKYGRLSNGSSIDSANLVGGEIWYGREVSNLGGDAA